MRYNIEERLRTAEITFSPHLFDRASYWNIDLGKIEDTIRTGKIIAAKSEAPYKLCIRRYFGKENITVTVILRIHRNFIEVKTAWPKKG